MTAETRTIYKMFDVGKLFEMLFTFSFGDPDGPELEAIVKVCWRYIVHGQRACIRAVYMLYTCLHVCIHVYMCAYMCECQVGVKKAK